MLVTIKPVILFFLKWTLVVILGFTLSGCATSEFRNSSESITEMEPLECQVELFSPSVNGAKSFFGHHVSGDYLFALNFYGLGPVLFVNSWTEVLAAYPKPELYMATSITNNCGELTVEFTQVYKGDGYLVHGLAFAHPLRRIKIRLTPYYAHEKDEGEFRLLDLKAEMLTSDTNKQTDVFTMHQAQRYLNPNFKFYKKDKKSVEQHEKMIQDMCTIFFGDDESVKPQDCAAMLTAQESR